jgi:hypothetical protein
MVGKVSSSFRRENGALRQAVASVSPSSKSNAQSNRHACTGMPNVRSWLFADIQRAAQLRPLYPRKQTFRIAMSAFRLISSA